MIRAGIDIGAGSLRLVLENEGTVFDEACAVALDSKGNALAIGDAALELKGTDEKISVLSPFEQGRLNVQALDALLEELCYEYRLFRPFQKTILLVSYPTALTFEIRELLKEHLMMLGAREVYFDQEVKIAAVGARLDLFLPVATTVLIAGSSNCDLVLFREGLIKARKSSMTLNGLSARELLKNWILDHYNARIADSAAEQVLREIACVKIHSSPASVTVRAVDERTGAVTALQLDENQMVSILAPLARGMAGWISSFAASLEEEDRHDLEDRGIIACGGFMKTSGLADLLCALCEIPIYLTDEPASTVLDGLELLLPSLKL